MGALLCSDCSHAPEDVPAQNLSDSKGASRPVAPSGASKFLLQVKLFQRLPESELPTLAMACEPKTFRSGDKVITEGDVGDAFYIIRSGDASVAVGGSEVAVLKQGDYFGENALLRDEPRTASIVAKSELQTFVISRNKFEEMGLREKLEFPQRKAVAGGAIKQLEVKPPSPKTAEERKLMVQALKSNQNLSSCVSLTDKQIAVLVDAAWKEKVSIGKELIQEGDLSADYFYIVQSGKFSISMGQNETQAKSANAAQAAAQNLGLVSAGGSFGELALLYFAPRAASVRAVQDSVVWVIDRKTFKDTLAKSADDMVKEYIAYLDKVQVLAKLKQDEKEAVAKALTEMSFSKSEDVFQQGEAGDAFYILVEGEVSVIKDGAEQTRLKASGKEAPMFGERALLTKEPRIATITVTSDAAKALVMDKATFDMILGPLEQLNKRGKDAPSAVKQPSAISSGTQKRFGNIERKHLKQLGLLGCGGFGAVELVEHVSTGETYALKALSKGYVVKSGMQQSVMSEKNVQLMCDSPFIVKLFETYNGSQTLYFLLELALGGELYATYNKKGLFGKEPHAKFYLAGVVLAFEHLHSKKIVFRDLKPENLLLNEQGRVKLTDMGLAKVIIGKTYTTCGTPDYFAPELIASTGHTHAVDWWTCGILLFELLSGHPPFESAYPMQIYQKVTKGINKVTFPPKCKGAAEDLVRSLCKKDPSERLPMKKGGVANLKKHTFFKGFDWQAFEKQSMEPPYKPQVKNKKDIGNFHARKDDLPPQVPYKDDGSGWDKDFATST
ncbi:egl-4 [Symbiodinium sp. CCMP2456]|nr:egl-4 [Symbiodinium sp. CCMP2456]